MKYLTTYVILAISIFFSGCAASMLIGDAVRSGQEDINIVTPSESSLSNLDKNTNLAISLDGVSESGKSIYAYGGGSTNPKVYSDMLQSELLKNGYSARSLDEVVTENSPQSKIDSLAKSGVSAVLSGNLSLGSSTSAGSAFTGGDYLDTGITSFTVKGIDTSDRSILFIISGEYGKAKDPSVIAEDISVAYKDILAGNLEKYE